MKRLIGRRGSKKAEAPSKNGFALVEALISLLCAMVLSTLCVVLLQCCVMALSVQSDLPLALGTARIRQYSALASMNTVEDGTLHISDARGDWTIEFDKNRLVRTPGYEILLEGIEDAWFEKEEGKIWLEVKEGSRAYRIQIR